MFCRPADRRTKISNYGVYPGMPYLLSPDHVTDEMRQKWRANNPGHPFRDCCVDWAIFLARTSAHSAMLIARPKDVDDAFKHLRSHDKTHIGNGAYQGAFAFTFTKSPKDDLTVHQMITAAEKLMNQKSCPVKKFAWYLEHKPTLDDSEAHPHIHGMYETADGKRIESKHFKRAWPIWGEHAKDENGKLIRLGAGFRGGYHRPVRSEEKYKDYIRKDGGKCDSFGLEETDNI